MAVPKALLPLTSASTPRRGVLLVIGGVVAAAYGLLVAGFGQMYGQPDVPRAVITVLVVVTAAIVLAPPFLHSVRVLEALAARTFLDADLPVLPVLPGRGTGASLRGAAWYAAHLVGGAVAVLSLLVCVPLAVTLVARQAGVTVLAQALGAFRDLPVVPAVVLAIVLLAVPAYVVWGLGELLRLLAPVLLGPSAQERIAQLEEDKRWLAARNALARDLHDSVGHALTVTSLQAAAAERALDRDPEFVRSALAAIATTGRDAAAELDRALGLLRAGEAPSAAEAAAGDRTLADLPQLVDELRTAGADVTLALPATDGVAPLVSRAGYAVVREATTNALRYGDGTIGIAVETVGPAVEVEVVNGLGGGGAGHRGSGRGLNGMRERAVALGGEMTWGVEEGRWVVRVRLPGEAS
ncbi:sensor histidine kinase [Georgenia subflava]|uniref:histidine kinase n=1 Tax=Georgenia subflava TaxID=1622177 RepID=A0A6N7EHM6_9MICO|nr:histidine kinase [Georgenia subflava]MPV35646.1 two-component sensor histidine kinase [Georgenia subflava]